VSRYPPEPWRLVGDLAVAVFLVPTRAMAAVPLPSGYRLLRLAGRVPAALVWVSYRPGGVLSYRELMLALPVRHRAFVRVTVPQVWVDSAASRAGGRELWALPKELADFAVGPDGGLVVRRPDGRDLAAVAFRPRLRLPGRWSVRFGVAQPDRFGPAIAPVRMSGRLEVGSAAVEFTPGSPLTGIRNRRPIFAATLRSFVLIIGRVQR
jgi:hypothetical protein